MISMTQPDRSFTWNPADYQASSPVQHLWACELIGKLSLSGREVVLDIGCGDGRVTAEIARAVPRGQVTGIDSSPEMIRYASENFPKARYPNLSFREMDARALSFTGEFDLVFSNAALHWISDHRPLITGIARALRPGGRMVVQMGGKGNAHQIFRQLETFLNRPEWSNYFMDFSFAYGFFSPDEYRQWLADAGLSPVRVELIRKDMTYSSIEGFAGWIRTTWLPWMAQVPEGERSRFIREFIDTFLLRYPAREGVIHVEMFRLEVEAEKRIS